ncbi:MAG: hypothetical protein CVU64_17175 [Deltaproteobacteria bacterium HGW-Deltaproteobacteria-21]|nr:MAG: hypothetical protein CVU64_17175 [Deltaproteobacteria bacterium HGW-Deltaproteobacteria-21]PKN65695.1 MAG: hypothetical protein CVU57_09020 [Deltaproteobacteria bacterium HGW-Deltaproteobacteria-15]
MGPFYSIISEKRLNLCIENEIHKDKMLLFTINYFSLTLRGLDIIYSITQERIPKLIQGRYRGV